MVFGPSSHDPSRKLFDNFDPNAPPRGTFSNPFFAPNAAPRPPPAHSMDEPPLPPVPAPKVESRDTFQDLPNPSSGSGLNEEKVDSVPDETLGGTWELEPPPTSSPPLPQPSLSLPTPPPFPLAAMDNLMRQLREEADRKARRTPEEVLAEEAAEKTKVEEQWRLKREREKNTWSSCHLSTDGMGMARSGPIVRDQKTGVVSHENWPKSETGREVAKVERELGSGSASLAIEQPATPSPENIVEDKKHDFAQRPTNPFDTKPYTDCSAVTERKKHQEYAPTDTDDEEEIESMLQALTLAEGKGEAAKGKRILIEQQKLEEEAQQKDIVRMRLAEIDAGWNCHYTVKGMAAMTTVSRNPYANEMKTVEAEGEKESIEQRHMPIEEGTLINTKDVQGPDDMVPEKQEAPSQRQRNPFKKPNPFTQFGTKRMQQLKTAGSEDEEETASRLARERLQQMKIGGQQNVNVDEQTLSGTTIVLPTVSDNYLLDAIPSAEELAREKKRLSKQRQDDHYNPQGAEPGHASLALKRPLAQRSKYRFEADSEDDEEIEDVGDTIGRLQTLARAMGNEIQSSRGYCFYTLPSKNGDVDEQIMMNRARLDRIR